MTEHVDILRKAGLRVTQQRIVVLSVLAASTDHPNADEIYTKTKTLDDTVSVATVYRTLALLEEAGLIRRIMLDNAPARFEMAPTSDHDHLIDCETGELIEIPGQEITDLCNRIAAELGYEIVSQHTILRARKKS